MSGENHQFPAHERFSRMQMAAGYVLRNLRDYLETDSGNVIVYPSPDERPAEILMSESVPALKNNIQSTYGVFLLEQSEINTGKIER